MRQVAVEVGMSQATRNIVCSQAAGEEMESFKTMSGKTEMRAAKRTLAKKSFRSRGESYEQISHACGRNKKYRSDLSIR